MDTSELSKTALARRYESMRGAVRRAREETKRFAHVTTMGVMTAAGGAVSGYLSTNGSLVKVPGTEVPSDFALGTALLLGCSLDMFDAQNDNVAAFAGGLLAAAAARETQKAVLTRMGTAGK